MRHLIVLGICLILSSCSKEAVEDLLHEDPDVSDDPLLGYDEEFHTVTMYYPLDYEFEVDPGVHDVDRFRLLLMQAYREVGVEVKWYSNTWELRDIRDKKGGKK